MELMKMRPWANLEQGVTKCEAETLMWVTCISLNELPTLYINPPPYINTFYKTCSLLGWHEALIRSIIYLDLRRLLPTSSFCAVPDGLSILNQPARPKQMSRAGASALFKNKRTCGLAHRFERPRQIRARSRDFTMAKRAWSPL